MKRTLWLAAALLAGGCATTGDPRQGGLFGWSRQKADARAATLQAQDASDRRHADFAQRRTAELDGRKAGLDDEVRRLDARVHRLVAENTALDTHLRALMRERRLDEAETARLRTLLAANAALQAAAPATPADAATGAASAHADAIDDQNARLHREVLALLRR